MPCGMVRTNVPFPYELLSIICGWYHTAFALRSAAKEDRPPPVFFFCLIVRFSLRKGRSILRSHHHVNDVELVAEVCDFLYDVVLIFELKIINS